MLGQKPPLKLKEIWAIRVRLELDNQPNQHQHKTTSYRLTWAERLKRVFHIDIERCEHCRGKVSIIATIKDPIVIKKILDHLDAKQSLDSIPAYQLPHAQAPPSQYFL